MRSMMVCPECRTQLHDEERPMCGACGWAASDVDGIPDFMPRREQRDGIVADYERNYARIAADDLEQSIQEPEYLEHLADEFAARVDGLEGAKICDLGVGQGALARSLLRRGAREVTVVDIEVQYLSRLKHMQGIRPVRANAEWLPFVNEFDVVVSTDVLEHVLNVGSCLYCVNRSLRTGGRFFARVPYKENLMIYSPHLGCPYEFVHLRTFDRPLICHALEAAGFSVERTWLGGYWNYVRRPLWSASGMGLKLREYFERWLRHRYGIDEQIRFVPVKERGWERTLAWLFLKPHEMTVRAVKVRDLAEDSAARA